MPFTDAQTGELKKPLDRAHVAERKQSGRALSYIEGWHAIAEANRIFGFDGWTRETIDIRMVSERERTIGQDKKPGWGVSYIAKVRVVVHGVTREGVGSGHGIDVDLGLAHESAIKEAETDAMKRALMTFGNPFGLALYDKTQANVCDTQQTEEPAPELAYDEEYLRTALKVIDDWKGNVIALKNWWDNEAKYRKEAGIVNEGEGVRAYSQLFEAFKHKGLSLAGNVKPQRAA